MCLKPLHPGTGAAPGRPAGVASWAAGPESGPRRQRPGTGMCLFIQSCRRRRLCCSKHPAEAPSASPLSEWGRRPRRPPTAGRMHACAGLLLPPPSAAARGGEHARCAACRSVGTRPFRVCRARDTARAARNSPARGCMCCSSLDCALQGLHVLPRTQASGYGASESAGAGLRTGLATRPSLPAPRPRLEL